MTVILFLIVLCVLVLVHEFGHFYAAKKCGVRVDEFGLGFPPRLWSVKKGETVYSINAIPFGGFVKIFGENPNDESISGPERERSFVGKPKWMQVIILSAGVIMNIAFAWVLFSIAFMSGMTTGVSESNAAFVENRHLIVIDVLPGSPAALAGLSSGDEILAFKAAGATTTPTSAASLQEAIKSSGGRALSLEIQRVPERKYFEITPLKKVLGDDYAIGISMDVVGTVKLPVHKAIWQGAALTGYMFKNIVFGISGLLKDAITGQADLSQISGPIGIARLVGDAGKLGFVYLLSFTAFISMNLAVLNLIPFPALDGGRIIFVGIEAIRGKMISPKISNAINAAGFALLILLMLFVTYKDILKLI